MSSRSTDRPSFVSCSPWVLLVVLIFIGAMFAWKFAKPLLQRVNDPGATPRLVTARGDLASDEVATIALFKAASPSVVHITTTERRYTDVFRMRATEVPQGTGSGFVWDDRGYVVTNFHVVQEALRAFVTLDDQTTFEAVHVGSDPEKTYPTLR